MSTSHTARPILQPLLVALPVGVLSCLLTLWLAQPTSAPPLPSTQFDIEYLDRRFDELASRLDDGLRTAELAESASTAERQPIGETDTETISRIIERLERLLLMVRSGGVGNQLSTQRDTPINWNELEALDLLYQRDQEVQGTPIN